MPTQAQIDKLKADAATLAADAIGVPPLDADAAQVTAHANALTADPPPPPPPVSINVALASNGGVASASSQFSASYPVAAIINGDRKGLNWGNGGGWNDATQHVYPDWVQIIFAGPKTIDHVVVYTVQDVTDAPVEPTDTMVFTKNGVTGFSVQGWDGAAWVTLGSAVTGNNLVKRTVAFPPYTTDRIRVVVTATIETGAYGGYSRVAEVEAWSVGSGSPPPPPPPPPPPVETFPLFGGNLQVTRISGDQYRPNADPTQCLILDLHGSGGGQLTYGDQLHVMGDERFCKIPGTEFRWGAQNDGYNAHRMYLQPYDRMATGDATTPSIETLWYGLTTVLGGPAYPYAERRLDALIAWAKTFYQFDQKKIVAHGGSMGAWGCAGYAMQRPDIFAAVFASRPRLRYSDSVAKVVTVKHSDAAPRADGIIHSYDITYDAAHAIATDGEAEDVVAHKDLVAYASNPANKMPWIAICLGLQDGFAPSSDFFDFIRAMQAVGRGFAAAWNNGNHSDGDIIGQVTNTYPEASFALGQGYPVFSNSTLDQDPAVDLVGGVNLGFSRRNLVETATSWSCEISNSLGAVTVDVLPHSDIFTGTVTKKTITIPVAAWVQVSFNVAAPPAPPTTIQSGIVTKPITRPNVLHAQGFFGGGRYDRNQGLVELTPGTSKSSVAIGLGAKEFVVEGWLAFVPGDYVRVSSAASPGSYMDGRVANYAGTTLDVNVAAIGGSGTHADWRVNPTPFVFTEDIPPSGQQPFPSAFTATLTHNGKALTTAAAAKGGTVILFPYDFIGAGVAEGWYMQSVTGSAPGWTVNDYPIYLRKGPIALSQTTMPVVLSSYSQVNDEIAPVWQGTTAPSVYAPIEQPLPPRVYDPFTTGDKLVLTRLAVFRPTDVYRPQLTREGVRTPTNSQNYMFGDYSEAISPWPLLDGARGRGTVICPTSIRNGHAGMVWFSDPWRGLVAVLADGTVRTMVGSRNKNNVPSYWARRKLSDFDLIGDFSSMPVERRGFHEVWDFVPDPDSLLLDMALPLVNGEHPHIVGGPRFIITDTKNNRFCKSVFTNNDVSAPPVVTEGDVNVPGAWGCEIVDQRLFISESTGSNIRVYDKNTLALIRMIPMPGPVFGIRAQDGVLKAGCKSAIWNVDLTTYAVTKGFSIPWDDNSHFINLSISDGTCYPRGTIAIATWSNVIKRGFPKLYNPNGTELDYLMALPSGAKVGGPGPDIWTPGEHPLTYTSAVDLSRGRMTFGTVQEGLWCLSRATTDDKPLPAGYSRGATKWWHDGWRLRYGDGAFNMYGSDLPWGVDPDIDDYLLGNGHVRTA